MPIFQLLTPLPIKLAAVNLPAKKKGQDIVHTTDIVVDCEGPNTLLDVFDPELRPMLYRALAENETVKGQAQLEGIEVVSDMPLLRSASLRMPIPLALKFAGYTMSIDRGLGPNKRPGGPKSNIEADEVEVKGIRLWAKEGGSVRIVMHLQSKNLSGEEVGQLRDMLKLETTLTLAAPKLQQDIALETEQRKAAGAPAAPSAPAASPAPKGRGKGGSVKAGIIALDKKRSAEQRKIDNAAAATDAFVAGAGGAGGAESAQPPAH